MEPRSESRARDFGIDDMAWHGIMVVSTVAEVSIQTL